MRVQLAVTFHDDTVRYYTVGLGMPWKVTRMYGVPFLVIGRGIPRTMIPLDNVQSFDVTEIIDD